MQNESETGYGERNSGLCKMNVKLNKLIIIYIYIYIYMSVYI